MANEHLTDQEIVRRQKMEELREKGIDPFGQAFMRTTNSKELFDKYGDKTKEELAEINDTAIIAGRIMTKRTAGKTGFMHIQDRYGKIQVYCRKDTLSELEFELFTKVI